VRIWLITIGEPLPIDGNGGDRLYRTGILATMLAKNGHEVVWWTSTFDHVRKQQRFPTDKTLALESGVQLKLLHGCGYARNVSLRRLIDHNILARKFSEHAKKMVCPDVILCSLPPLELPVAVVRYGKAHHVPVVIDIRDLWPDIFLDLAPKWRWLQLLMNLGLTPMWRQVRTACQNAFSITGNAPQFVEWGLVMASRTGTPLDRSFPHGYAVGTPDLAKTEKANAFWENHGIRNDGDVFVACFFGAIGPQSELDTVLSAARLLERRGRKFKFVLCGKGDHLKSLREKSVDISSVIFPGWIDAVNIWTLMRMSTVGLAVYRSNIGYVTNLPNKPIEYFSAGLPVVSSLRGYLEHFLSENNCGITYPNGDAEALAKVLSDLDYNRRRLMIMSDNASKIFSEKFEAGQVYGRMMTYLQDVVEAYSKLSHPQKEV